VVTETPRSGPPRRCVNGLLVVAWDRCGDPLAGAAEATLPKKPAKIASCPLARNTLKNSTRKTEGSIPEGNL
jgi:hypothetical protein